MTTEVRIPELGESISEVQVADWMREVGDIVAVDDPIAEIDSDKATVELPAPVGGRIVERRVEAGAFCNVGDVVAVIDESVAVETPAATAATAATAQPAAPAAAPDARVMPAARRILDQAGTDVGQVSGTGPGGRVLKEDARRATITGSREDHVRPMSPIRRRIAERLVAAHHAAALLPTFNEHDMTAVKTMRARHQDAFVDRYGVKLGFMSFFTKAVIEALRLVPNLNAEIRGQDIVQHDYHDIGIAIGSGKGLVVPVIRNAETLGFGDIEQTIADLAARAQNKKLDLRELEGGTFTISNGGVYGSMLSTPIVNPPQSGILGLHVIQDRAVVIDGEIVVRPMMYVALTYDHRIVDGREGVAFLKHVKECIEAPERLMLEI